MHIIASSILGVVFLAAGAAKLANHQRWSIEARELGVPGQLASLTPALPYVEIALGAALVAQIAPVVSASIALLLLAAFTMLIARVLAHGRRPSCACFGTWSARPLGRGHVVRNVVLMALALVALVTA